MSDTVIKVENLSKSYLIRHQTGESYTALRDVLANSAKGIGSRLFSTAANSQQPTASKEEFWALDDVSFEVKQGERVGIIGRNGAGKSTLLKILSRITEPTRGQVKVKGRVASLLEVGTGFHPELTGRENIYLNGAILGMSREEIRRKFDEIVDFAEVEKFLDTPIKRYSSGMYVRLAFAVAAHLEPEILVVDEVLAVGDAAFQKKCLGKMRDVSVENGRTVMFVSHDLAAVNTLCTRAILLGSGELKDDGRPQNIISHYLSCSSTPNTDIKLQDRTDRRGNGIAKYTNLTIYDVDRKKLHNEVKMGASLVIELSFQTQQEISRPVFGIFFKDSLGTTILRAYSHESSDYVPIQSIGAGCLTCKFASLPLMYGDYSIALWLGRPGECIDYIEDVVNLSVAQSDVYETGVLPDSNNGGYCFTQHSWTHNYLQLKAQNR